MSNAAGQSEAGSRVGWEVDSEVGLNVSKHLLSFPRQEEDFEEASEVIVEAAVEALVTGGEASAGDAEALEPGIVGLAETEVEAVSAGTGVEEAVSAVGLGQVMVVSEAEGVVSGDERNLVAVAAVAEDSGNPTVFNLHFLQFYSLHPGAVGEVELGSTAGGVSTTITPMGMVLLQADLACTGVPQEAAVVMGHLAVASEALAVVGIAGTSNAKALVVSMTGNQSGHDINIWLYVIEGILWACVRFLCKR